MKNEKNYFEIFFKFSLDFYRNNFVVSIILMVDLRLIQRCYSNRS
jgi:hypothetical protein